MCGFPFIKNYGSVLPFSVTIRNVGCTMLNFRVHWHFDLFLAEYHFIEHTFFVDIFIH